MCTVRGDPKITEITHNITHKKKRSGVYGLFGGLFFGTFEVSILLSTGGSFVSLLSIGVSGGSVFVSLKRYTASSFGGKKAADYLNRLLRQEM